MVAIKAIFGEGSGHSKEFEEIGFFSMVIGDSGAADARAFSRGLSSADAMLASMIDEVANSDEKDKSESAHDALATLTNLFTKFHRVARQLRHRHGARPTLDIDDEYDVQDLLHALLKIWFDDVRAEEWTPSYAGASSRMDFLLKAEAIVVEVKKARRGLLAKELGEQLLVDKARYESHPDCKVLVCFIYDPENLIGNPLGLRRDLEKQAGPPTLRVMVAP